MSDIINLLRKYPRFDIDGDEKKSQESATGGEVTMEAAQVEADSLQSPSTIQKQSRRGRLPRTSKAEASESQD